MALEKELKALHDMKKINEAAWEEGEHTKEFSMATEFQHWNLTFVMRGCPCYVLVVNGSIPFRLRAVRRAPQNNTLQLSYSPTTFPATLFPDGRW